jgi:hypothetical protein
MSNPQTAATAGSTTPSRTAQAFFSRAKIIGARRMNTEAGPLWLTLCKLPNPSEFESGGTIELRSAQRLGQSGDEFTGWCRIGGYARQYRATDKETGEQVLVRTAEVRLTVIEA